MNQTIRIRLKACLDPREPELEAEVVDGTGRCFTKVKVVTPHPVWRGAIVGKDHVRVCK
jgi:hypothetical protein